MNSRKNGTNLGEMTWKYLDKSVNASGSFPISVLCWGENWCVGVEKEVFVKKKLSFFVVSFQ